MTYLLLFLSFMKIGVLGFGGGMAVISLIQNEVAHYGWMTETEFVDIVAVSQVTPGPVGINCATYVGYTVGGIWGSLIASVAIVLPSLVIMLTICGLYEKLSSRWNTTRTFQTVMRIIRVLVLLLIASAAYRLVTPATFIDGRSWVVFGVVFALTVLPLWVKNKATDWLSHPILLILVAGLAGYLIY